MILASVSSSKLSLSWGWPAAASIGGIILLVGLWLEYRADKIWHPNLDDFRSQHSKKKFGEILVMLGVVVEIVIGFALAAKDERTERQTANQIAQMTTNDPLNLPVVSASLEVKLYIVPPEGFIAWFRKPIDCQALGNVSDTNRFVLLLHSISADPGAGPGGDLWYTLRFDPRRPLERMKGITKSNVTARMIGECVNLLNIWFTSFSMTNADIKGGSGTLFINGRPLKTFKIAPGEIRNEKGYLTNSDSVPITTLSPK